MPWCCLGWRHCVYETLSVFRQPVWVAVIPEPIRCITRVSFKFELLFALGLPLRGLENLWKNAFSDFFFSILFSFWLTWDRMEAKKFKRPLLPQFAFFELLHLVYLRFSGNMMFKPLLLPHLWLYFNQTFYRCSFWQCTQKLFLELKIKN